MQTQAHNLFHAHTTDVLRRARNLSHRHGFDYDDLRQVLLLTLWTAALAFRPSLGVPFLPYLQQRLTWSAMKTIYRENEKLPEILSLDKESPDGKRFIEESAEEVSQREQLSYAPGQIRMLHRAADIHHLIRTSKELTHKERKALTERFIDGEVDDEKYDRSTRTGLAKIRKALGISLKREHPIVDRRVLVADMLTIIGDEETYAVTNMARRLAERPCWEDLSCKSLFTELKHMGVRTFTISGKPRNINPRRFKRTDLLQASLSVGAQRRA